MDKISFSTGRKQFELQGGQVLEFNPSDPNLMARLHNAIEAADEIQGQYENAGMDGTDFRDAEGAKRFLEFVDSVDAKMQKILDGVFEVPIDRAAFDNQSLYALADGLPLWANFLFAVMDKMENGIVAERKATNPRLEKIAQKYKRK